MNRFSFLIFAAVASFGAPAFAAPGNDMCRFVAAAADGGADGAIDYIKTISKHWNENQRDKLSVVVGTEMEKFTYSGGQVYRIAHLPGVVEEFFLTLNLDTIVSSVYARVLYEGDSQNLTFVNIDFNSSYYDIISQPFLQEPEPINCR